MQTSILSLDTSANQNKHFQSEEDAFHQIFEKKIFIFNFYHYYSRYCTIITMAKI